jgi:hypothetical protein
MSRGGQLKRKLAAVIGGLVMAAGIVAVEASPAMASYPCLDGWSCYYDTNPYNNSATWVAPSCGWHDLRPIGWRDRISYVANRGGGTAYLWDDLGGENWVRIALVPQGSQLQLGSSTTNRTDKVEIIC